LYPTICEKVNTSWSNSIYRGMQDWFSIQKVSNVRENW
jgi:hypothetical protein